MKKKITRLFIVIQPLQYLQSLELKNSNDVNHLIVLGANSTSQLHDLVNKKDWSRVVWLDFNGTFIHLIKNRKKIQNIMASFTRIDEIVVSSYYNEFMNMVVNHFSIKQIILLEDGVANLFIDTNSRYNSFKFTLKFYCCKLFKFDVNPINNVKIFTVFQPSSGKIPQIATEVIVNEYRRLRSRLSDFEKSVDIYFISSAFIKCGMISKVDYIEFLIKLANEYSEQILNIILHRFDDLVDFETLNMQENVNVIVSSGPIELYFILNKVNPQTVITAGSGATESLKIIYGIDVDIVMPELRYFKTKFQGEMESLAAHFGESHSVRFI